MGGGPLTFLAPLGLLGLLLLPLFWWLLRATPPSPKNQIFPPLRILADVVTYDETPDRTPWWLLLFRLGLVALLAIALARPIVSQMQTDEVRPVVLIIDDGYGAAANWSQIIQEAVTRITAARRENVDVALVISHADEFRGFMPASVAINTIKSLSPKALAMNAKSVLEASKALDMRNADAVWLSGGLDYEDAKALAAAFSNAKTFKIIAPQSERSPVLAGVVEETATGLRIGYSRVDSDSQRNLEAVAYGSDGRVVGRAPLVFALGSKTAEAQFTLPADLRNRVSRIMAEGSSSAASVKLLDDSWGRPVIGILSNPESNVQPLLSDVYYVEKALGDNADVYTGLLADLLPLGPSILIMSDSARIEDEALTDFVDNGGMLVRFAGPKLAARTDDLLPVALRYGGRALGGALTWEEPQTLDLFADDSPFYGLTVPDDVTVTQQVMAEPGGETDNRTWARLSDGSPVVTAAVRGQGRIVLFHVTSSPEWSNLAVSGLYVDMLKRLLPLARQTPVKIKAQGGAWAPERVLDGFGRLTAPPAGLQAIDDGGFEAVVRDISHLPGLYRQGARRTALNTVKDLASIGPIAALPNVERGGYSGAIRQSLTGILLGIGLAMLALDALISLLVSGRLRRAFAKPAVLALAIAGLITAPPLTDAQTVTLETDTLNIHLAYVITGDSRVDRISEAGLRGVTAELNRRTTVEPGEPRGVILESSPLPIYPMLYWPVRRDAPALTDAQSVAVNAYMTSGGTIVFDTQDAGETALRGGAAHPGLARISQSLDIPPLTSVPEDHVLTKSFFLLSKFPGRWADGQVYVDATNVSARDGVASVIVGSNDWASGWAINTDGEFVGAIEEGMTRQREFANRFGVNLVMYVLAGNYKADQVHVPALLERLGRRGTSMQRTPSVTDPDR